jgi:diguanylate cyclase (GGDEF)-like protein
MTWIGWCGAAARFCLLPLALGVIGPAGAAWALDPVEQKIQSLTEEGRSRPAEAARALQALLPDTGPRSAQRLELLAARGALLVQARDNAGVAAVTSELQEWRRNQWHPRAESTLLALQARVALVAGNRHAAEPLLAQAVAQLPADTPNEARFAYVKLQAKLSADSGRLEDAFRLQHEAMKLADESGVASRRADARSQLAIVYFQAKQAPRARALSDESLAMAQAAQDWMSLALASNTRSILLDAVGDIAGEQKSLEDSIAYARRAGAKLEESLYLANMSNFYLLIGDNKTAIARAEAALPLSRELGDITGQFVALANMGLGHIALRRFDVGKRLVGEAIALERQRGYLPSLADIYNEEARYLEKAGDTAGAVQAYHEYRKLADELFQRDNQKAILAMQEQFDAEQRSARLELLNRENSLKAAQLGHRERMQWLWLLAAAAFVVSIGGVALLYWRVRRSNRALVSTNEMLRLQGERDPLTGLANRRHFQAAMQWLAPAGRLEGTLCMIDLDHFKPVNDRHGHAAGDAVLVEIAQRLRSTLRDDDLIVRWGGEEFLVALRPMDPAQVNALVERMLAAVALEPVAWEGRSIGMTASIGYATFPLAPPAPATGWARAVDLVDSALYLAKAQGRNRACGVQDMQVRDEAGFDRVATELEAAGRDGRAALVTLSGPLFERAAA